MIKFLPYIALLNLYPFVRIFGYTANTENMTKVQKLFCSAVLIVLIVITVVEFNFFGSL